MPLNARFAHTTTYYTLTAEKFGDVAVEYEELNQVYQNVYSNALASKERQEDALDYSIGRIRGHFSPTASDNLNDAQL